MSVLNPAVTTGRVVMRKSLAVFDPSGTVAAFSRPSAYLSRRWTNLKTLPEGAKVLLVGRDALDATESTSSRLAAYASSGHAVIVLEQKHPLRFQALPAEIEATHEDGRVAFTEDPDHPVFRNLRDKDFFTWGPDERVYRDAYRKPTRGARSLLQCGDTLRNSALVEVPAGQGVMLLSQLLVAEKLADSAAAQQLLLNLIGYGAPTTSR